MNSCKGPSIRSVHDIESQLLAKHKVLCLYSGGLDGTFLLSIISRLRCAEIVALNVGLGGAPIRDDVRAFVVKQGVKIIERELTQSFSEEFVAKSIRARGCYLGNHPICASLSRPFIAREAVSFAKEHGFDFIIHTSTRSQNSLRRFNQAFQFLHYEGLFGSPFELSSISRSSKISALASLGAPQFSLLSEDINIWGREFEFGNIDDPENSCSLESCFTWTQPNSNLKNLDLSLEFEQGQLKSVNGSPKPLHTLLAELNHLVGSFGLGRYWGLEEIQSGWKVQEVREMPAAFILFDAMQHLEAACLPAECIREKMHLQQIWVREAVEGRWFAPLREAAEAFISNLTDRLSGQICYNLKANRAFVTTVIAKNPLYIRSRDAFELQSQE